MAASYGSIVRLSPEAALSLGSMEGMAEAHALPAPWIGPDSLLPGVGAALATALLATGLHYLPFSPFQVLERQAGQGLRRPLSAALLAIVAGVLIGNLLPVRRWIGGGCKAIVHHAIPVAIACIGAGLNFAAVGDMGVAALGIMLAGVLIAFGSSYGLARALGLRHQTAALLGVGTGICGSSAIVATAPLIDADEEDVVLAVGSVNLLGLVAMLALPAVAAAVHLGPNQFGIWCGTAIHAVPQVLAAADAHQDSTGRAVEWATLVKLGRIALLMPLVFALALHHARSTNATSTDRVAIRYARLIPWFVWGFLAVALLNTAGWLPGLSFAALEDQVELTDVLTRLGKLLLTLAMAAIGLQVNLAKLWKVGARSLLAGIGSSAVLAAATLLMIILMT